MSSKFTRLFVSSKKWLWLAALGGVLTQQQAQAQNSTCGTSDPAGNPSQTGLYAEYYAGYWYNSAADNAARSTFFNTRQPAVRRIENSLAVNFTANNSWGDLYNGGAGPAGGTAANPDNFSARYRGGINIPTTGNYIFYLSSDDAGYLWIDGDARQQNPSLDNANIKITGTGTDIASGTLALAQGYHDLAILYGENGGNNYLILKYSTDGGATKTVVPSTWFCTGIRSVPTALAYAPATTQATFGSSASSVAPTVVNGNSAVTNYAITSTGLPAGISINATTGVLTANATVLPGTYSVSVAATNGNGTATFAGAYTFVVNAGCGGLDAYGNPAQSGLLAEYYKGYFNDQPGFFTNNTAFPLGSTNNPARIQRVEGAPDYRADNAWSTSGLNLFSAGVAGGTNAQPTTFSARYRGKLYISTAGTYTFSVSSDDASYLLIDGTATAQTAAAPYTVNNGGGHSNQIRTGTATLTVGWHNLVLLYGQDPSSSYLSLQYAGPAGSGISQQVIPSNVLCTAIESVPTGLAYAPGVTTYATGTTASSVVPTMYSGNTAPVTYAITNGSSLPAGITINPATGVLTGDGTVAPGTYTVSLSATNAYGTAAFPTVHTFNVLAAGCTGNDAGGNAAQAGLYGEYYTGYFGSQTGADTDANLAFFSTNTPKLRATTPTLNFTANNAWSAAGLNLVTAGAASNTDAAPATFSARYRGRIYIATAGTYTFSLNSDDASYVFLDEAATAASPTVASATVNNGGVHSSGTAKSGSKQLAVGLHDILVLYGQNPTDSYLTLQYAGPAGSGINQQVVPATVLCSSSSPRPLPVTLTRFDAQALGAVVAVGWATASEQSSASFEVERSADGVSFAKIGQVAAAGTTSQGQQYQLLDRAPLMGLSYYRLRQLDLDGTAHYSPVVPVQLASEAAAPLLTLAPNPTTGRVVVQLVQATAQAATLQVLDALGRTVHQQALPAAATQQQTLDLQALPTGVYLVRVTSAAGVATQRLVRQ